jgi:hypothetical protein
MLESPVLGAAALGVLAALVALFLLVRFVRGRRGDGRPNTDAQRDRDRAHREAQRRAPEEAARKGERYELVVAETQYDRAPPEVRGTINGLQTFVREIPDPDGADALAVGETISVQVTDYGSKGTTAQARFLERC